MASAFDEADTDGDNKVSNSELRDFAEKHGVELTRAQLRFLERKFDKDGEKGLSKEEFDKIMETKEFKDIVCEEEEYFYRCSMPPFEPREPGDGSEGKHDKDDSDPLRMVIHTTDKWPANTNIRIAFMAGSATLQQMVKNTIKKWFDLGLGLRHTYVNYPADASDIRILFNRSIWRQPNAGHWSAVGTQCQTRDARTATMNLDMDEWSYEDGTVLHEMGHALGATHEAQSPNATIQWDEPKVIDDFKHSQGWSEALIRFNILTPANWWESDATRFDPNSIMLYQFDPKLIKNWAATGMHNGRNLVLSQMDKQKMQQTYPGIAPAPGPAPGPVPVANKGISVSGYPWWAATNGNGNYMYIGQKNGKNSYRHESGLDCYVWSYSDGWNSYWLIGRGQSYQYNMLSGLDASVGASANEPYDATWYGGYSVTKRW